jgi:hypothetical protein
MNRMRTAPARMIATLGALALLSVAPVADARPAGSGLLSRLDVTYVREITQHLGTIGSMPLGFRAMATPEDQETAQYLADQMTAIGLEDVSVEEFTGDGWLFKGATVHVSGPGLDTTFQASSLGGIPGTGTGGISGTVVPVGYGMPFDYRGLDVRNKIVFAWWDYDHLGSWPNYIAMEAKTRGAEAVIMASAPKHAWYSAGNGRALGSNDAECSTTLCAPLTVISKRSAATLVDSLAAGKVTSTVTLNAKNLIGSTAYQPIGQITGSVYPDKPIVFTAHQDAWFTGAADDSVAVGMMMAIAKAAVDSGYQPEHTWIFAPVTGEEYGLADAYYDWLQGATQRITVSHPEWQTDAVAILNWEVHSPPYHLSVSLPHEMRTFVGDSLGSSEADGLISGFSMSEVWAWQDNFTYTTTGAPSVTFEATGSDYWTRYHTDYDSLSTLDFPGLAPFLQAETRVALDLDGTLLPYGFGNRIHHLGTHIRLRVMRANGADADAVGQAYDRLVAAWDAASGVSPSVCAADALREGLRISLDDLTALSFLDDTIYPHEQSQYDVAMLDAAIARVKAGDWGAAQDAIGGVDLNSLALYLSRRGFLVEQLHHDPTYANISWGAQGQLSEPIDLYRLWEEVGKASRSGGADRPAWLAELHAARSTALITYRDRVEGLAATINAVAAQLEAAVACP